MATMSMPRPSFDPMQQAQQLFTGHHGWLLSRLKARLRNTAEAQDVASETFLRVVAAPGPTQIEEPRAFLTTIAKRLLFTLWRRRELEQAYLETLAQRQQEFAPSPEERALLLETLNTIAHALDGLQLKARQSFLLSQLDGMTYQAIAEQLNISHSTVRRHMTEAFRRIAIAQLQQEAGLAPTRSEQA